MKINTSLDRGVFSASQLETYFACPYKQFLRYGIRLKPREEGVLRTLETGTLMHAIMEKVRERKRHTKTRRTRLSKAFATAP
ncbi:MAG: PD-(D/E)XK nuclease family protein [Clostridiales bacterium]|nr:MAG: PD-(D/E)XK nuclease family protein [Clostridiales bacterium]